MDTKGGQELQERGRRLLREQRQLSCSSVDHRKRSTAGPGDAALRWVVEFLQQCTHRRTSSLSKHETANDFQPVCCNRWTNASTYTHIHSQHWQAAAQRQEMLLLVCKVRGNAHSSLCACVCAPTDLLFVPPAFLINSHSPQSGLAELNFTRSQTRTVECWGSIQHLATHHTISPFYLPPLQSAWWGVGMIKRGIVGGMVVLSEIKSTK